MNFGKGHRYIVCSNQIPVEIPHAKLRPGGGGGLGPEPTQVL